MTAELIRGTTHDREGKPWHPASSLCSDRCSWSLCTCLRGANVCELDCTCPLKVMHNPCPPLFIAHVLRKSNTNPCALIFLAHVLWKVMHTPLPHFSLHMSEKSNTSKWRQWVHVRKESPGTLHRCDGPHCSDRCPVASSTLKIHRKYLNLINSSILNSWGLELKANHKNLTNSSLTAMTNCLLGRASLNSWTTSRTNSTTSSCVLKSFSVLASFSANSFFNAAHTVSYELRKLLYGGV